MLKHFKAMLMASVSPYAINYARDLVRGYYWGAKPHG